MIDQRRAPEPVWLRPQARRTDSPIIELDEPRLATALRNAGDELGMPGAERYARPVFRLVCGNAKADPRFPVRATRDDLRVALHALGPWQPGRPCECEERAIAIWSRLEDARDPAQG